MKICLNRCKISDKSEIKKLYKVRIKVITVRIKALQSEKKVKTVKKKHEKNNNGKPPSDVASGVELVLAHYSQLLIPHPSSGVAVHIPLFQTY